MPRIEEIEEALTAHSNAWAYKMMERGHIVFASRTKYRLYKERVEFSPEAVSLWRDSYTQSENVKWQSEEPNGWELYREQD